MKDIELITIARRIDKHMQAIRDLGDTLLEDRSTTAIGFCKGLDANGLISYAWARHIVHSYIQRPERWETGNFGIRWKRRQ